MMQAQEGRRQGFGNLVKREGQHAMSVQASNDLAGSRHLSASAIALIDLVGSRHHSALREPAPRDSEGSRYLFRHTPCYVMDEGTPEILNGQALPTGSHTLAIMLYPLLSNWEPPIVGIEYAFQLYPYG